MLGPIAVVAALSVAAIEYGRGVYEQTQEVEAQQNLRTATQTAILVADPSDFETASIAEVSEAEPSLAFTTASSSGPHSISVAASADRWIGAVQDRAGDCHYVVLRSGGTSEDTFFGACHAGTIARAIR
jgi:hypothetical protein